LVISHAFDATALVMLLGDAEPADRIQGILSRSNPEEPSVCMSAVNWGEVYYEAWHFHGRDFANERAVEIAELPILIVSADRAQARLAAELQAKYRLPYADAFAAALALSHGAKLVTADSDFLKVESKLEIVWLVKPRRH
jgi:predicted nucleic acid-binding protein